MNKRELLNELRNEGFSEVIINAFGNVEREKFVPEDYKSMAYENMPLSIGYGATISQPYTIAFMLDLLELKDNLRILEVGSGSGYVLALINQLSENSEIYGIERIGKLAERSKDLLKNKKNIKIFHGDGTKGLKGKDFDRILVSASAEEIPDKLVSQLKDNGIMAIPVRDSIFKLKKTNGKIIKKEFPGFVFVPLVEDDA